MFQEFVLGHVQIHPGLQDGYACPKISVLIKKTIILSYKIGQQTILY